MEIQGRHEQLFGHGQSNLAQALRGAESNPWEEQQLQSKYWTSVPSTTYCASTLYS